MKTVDVVTWVPNPNYISPSAEKNSGGVPAWIHDFFDFFIFTLLPLLLALFLLILLLMLIRWIISLFKKEDITDQHSTTISKTYCCNGCKEKPTQDCECCCDNMATHLEVVDKIVKNFDKNKNVKISYNGIQKTFNVKTSEPKYIESADMVKIIQSNNYQNSAELIYIVENLEDFPNLPKFKNEEEFKTYIKNVLKEDTK